MNNTCFTFPSSAPGQAAWAADPSCRWTFGIALLCLSTTIICIWSSVHRDIHLKRLPTMPSLIRDAPLALVALFAPELMFYFALNQYLCARNLVKIAKRFESRQRHFTLKHGFYATMGGFVLENASGHPRKLTSYGAEQFMDLHFDLVPNLSLESISDREKSTNLGKALLIVQVVWFCLNCISRLAERLPLTLLEVTTLAHGLFTLLSYAMWWFKPLNIEEPTRIRNDSIFTGTTSSSVPKFEELLHNWGFSTFKNRFRERFTDLIVTSIVPFIYGFLHFLALQAQYPNSVERSLWRIASVVVMTSGVCAAATDLIRFDIIKINERFAIGRSQRFIASCCYVTLYRIIPFVYTICSGYLLVESVRQLWYLPAEAYIVASWSYYIPHWL
ncbi:hypothetical protein SCHPADRAFT_839669 [Schizopora paradoxa]|uniref:Uncharacterized protein n=1 Tax=Schizopora paradoxa TaxID=27342 RepID=A0A0H2RK95_9AGAM|nr:hypothetical protein SCHPADRAFT_839669 [Schizopora paradoxa]